MCLYATSLTIPILRDCKCSRSTWVVLFTCNERRSNDTGRCVTYKISQMKDTITVRNHCIRCAASVRAGWLLPAVSVGHIPLGVMPLVFSQVVSMEEGVNTYRCRYEQSGSLSVICKWWMVSAWVCRRFCVNHQHLPVIYATGCKWRCDKRKRILNAMKPRCDSHSFMYVEDEQNGGETMLHVLRRNIDFVTVQSAKRRSEM